VGTFLVMKRALKTSVCAVLSAIVWLLLAARPSFAVSQICGLEQIFSEQGSSAAMERVDRHFEEIAKEIEAAQGKVNPQWKRIQAKREEMRLADVETDYKSYLRKKRTEMEACFGNKKCAKKMDIDEFLAFWMEYSTHYAREVPDFLLKDPKKRIVWRKGLDTFAYPFSFMPGISEVMDFFPGAEINRARAFDFVKDPGARRVGVRKGNRWRLGKTGQELMLARAEQMIELLAEQNHPAPRFFKFINERNVARGVPSGSGLKKFKTWYADFIDAFVSSVNDRKNIGRKFIDEVDPKEVQGFGEQVRKKGFRGTLDWHFGNIKKAASKLPLADRAKYASKRIRHLVLITRAFLNPIHSPYFRMAFWTLNGVVLLDLVSCAKDRQCMLLAMLREAQCYAKDLVPGGGQCYRDKMEERMGAETVQKIDELKSQGENLGKERVEEISEIAETLRNDIQNGNADDKKRALEMLRYMYPENAEEKFRQLESARNAKEASEIVTPAEDEGSEDELYEGDE